MSEDNKNTQPLSDETDKMLGAMIPETVYWKFKSEVAKRKETMQQAILNAAYLYIELEGKDINARSSDDIHTNGKNPCNETSDNR